MMNQKVLCESHDAGAVSVTRIDEPKGMRTVDQTLRWAQYAFIRHELECRGALALSPASVGVLPEETGTERRDILGCSVADVGIRGHGGHLEEGDVDRRNCSTVDVDAEFARLPVPWTATSRVNGRHVNLGDRARRRRAVVRKDFSLNVRLDRPVLDRGA